MDVWGNYYSGYRITAVRPKSDGRNHDLPPFCDARCGTEQRMLMVASKGTNDISALLLLPAGVEEIDTTSQLS